MDQHEVQVCVLCDVGHAAHCAVPTNTRLGPRAAPQASQWVGWGSAQPWWVRRSSTVVSYMCSNAGMERSAVHHQWGVRVADGADTPAAQARAATT
ncbi:hypothetical protein LIX17_26100 (plasmid) [Mycobacterium avium subsp. hominissuis]|uniref:hypothetical protein n=1 Tax=Mycobacterium avium TaxID=1764 RepID=UPI003140A40D